MESIAISEFKATCLAVLERVRTSGQSVLVTRRGEPIAEIGPPPAAGGRSWLGSARGTGEIVGDIVAPAARPGGVGGASSVKVLLDTHIWLWGHLEPERLGTDLKATLEDASTELWLSPISVWETLLLADKGRIDLGPSPTVWVGTWLANVPMREAVLDRRASRLPAVVSNWPMTIRRTVSSRRPQSCTTSSWSPWRSRRRSPAAALLSSDSRSRRAWLANVGRDPDAMDGTTAWSPSPPSEPTRTRRASSGPRPTSAGWPPLDRPAVSLPPGPSLQPKRHFRRPGRMSLRAHHRPARP